MPPMTNAPNDDHFCQESWLSTLNRSRSGPVCIRSYFGSSNRGGGYASSAKDSRQLVGHDLRCGESRTQWCQVEADAPQPQPLIQW